MAVRIVGLPDSPVANAFLTYVDHVSGVTAMILSDADAVQAHCEAILEQRRRFYDALCIPRSTYDLRFEEVPP
jgi:hypothetical protein